jgi:hypothetical protein
MIRPAPKPLYCHAPCGCHAASQVVIVFPAAGDVPETQMLTPVIACDDCAIGPADVLPDQHDGVLAHFAELGYPAPDFSQATIARIPLRGEGLHRRAYSPLHHIRDLALGSTDAG